MDMLKVQKIAAEHRERLAATAERNRIAAARNAKAANRDRRAGFSPQVGDAPAGLIEKRKGIGTLPNGRRVVVDVWLAQLVNERKATQTRADAEAWLAERRAAWVRRKLASGDRAAFVAACTQARQRLEAAAILPCAPREDLDQIAEAINLIIG